MKIKKPKILLKNDQHDPFLSHFILKLYHPTSLSIHTFATNSSFMYQGQKIISYTINDTEQ